MSMMYFYMALITSAMGIQATAAVQKSFINKHLKIAAVNNDYISFFCNGKQMEMATSDECDGNLTYGGTFWELLKLIKQARNVTITIMRPDPIEWGVCSGKNNCTGMIGMVNRREVDFALGTFH